MTQTKLLVTGLVLVAAGLIGMSLQAPSAGSWGMPMGPMMGWWESPQTSSEQTPPIAGAPTIEVQATEFAFQPDQLVTDIGGLEEFFDGYYPRLVVSTLPVAALMLVGRVGDEWPYRRR